MTPSPAHQFVCQFPCHKPQEPPARVPRRSESPTSSASSERHRFIGLRCAFRRVSKHRQPASVNGQLIASGVFLDVASNDIATGSPTGFDRRIAIFRLDKIVRQLTGILIHLSRLRAHPDWPSATSFEIVVVAPGNHVPFAPGCNHTQAAAPLGDDARRASAS